MSKMDSKFQKVFMSWSYRGKEIFKPLNTGWIDEHVACVREWVANIFFYTKDGRTIMIDAGYNYDRLREKMGWLDMDPAAIRHILITHQDTDHVGAVERDSDGLFRRSTLYLSEIENRYLTGEVRRKVLSGKYKLSIVHTDNPRVLLQDKQVLDIEGIKVEALLVPGHTWGHMVYLVDDRYLFTGDTLWFGADGGYSFINILAEDNELAKRSLEALEKELRAREIAPKIITGHTAGRTAWTLPLPIEIRSATAERSRNPTTRRRPMTATTSGTTPKKTPGRSGLPSRMRASTARAAKGCCDDHFAAYLILPAFYRHGEIRGARRRGGRTLFLSKAGAGSGNRDRFDGSRNDAAKAKSVYDPVLSRHACRARPDYRRLEPRLRFQNGVPASAAVSGIDELVRRRRDRQALGSEPASSGCFPAARISHTFRPGGRC